LDHSLKGDLRKVKKERERGREGERERDQVARSTEPKKN